MLLALKTRAQAESKPCLTRRRPTLVAWSRRYHWQARAAAFDAEQEAVRRETFAAEARRQEVENARMLHQVGQGCLAIGSLILNSYANAEGTLAKPAGLDEAAKIIKTGSDILRLASGQPTDVVGLADLRSVQQRFEHADHETKVAVLAGLRALRRLQRGSGDDADG